MKIKNLAILSGNKVTIKDGNIKYLPEFETDTDNKKKPITANIRAETDFYQGILELKFKAKKYETGVLLHSLEDGEFNSAIGLSLTREGFVIQDNKNDIAEAGSLKNYGLNSEIKIKIEWLSSKCKLFINNVLLCEVRNFKPKMIPIHLRITSTGEVNVYDIQLTSVRPKLFVVMQFTENYNKLYEEVILPIAEKKGFECIRADEFHTSTPILTDIISSIEDSSAIIADITPDNPNVFYEIGYSHAIKKPTILLCDKKREKLPFDVSGFRTLFYENSIAGKSKIEKSLEKYLENIVK